MDLQKEVDKVLEIALTKYKGMFNDLNEEQKEALTNMVVDSFLSGLKLAKVIMTFQEKHVH